MVSLVLLVTVALASTLAAVLWLFSMVLRHLRSTSSPSGNLNAGGETGPSRNRGREPAPFNGSPGEFNEWLFSMEEALRSLKPLDPVGYVASFLTGNARKWLISAWGLEGLRRPASWPEFRTTLVDTFAERYSDEFFRLRLVRAKQETDLEEYIGRFTGLCLSAQGLDQLTKATLFTEGLASAETKKEVRREHPRSLAEAVRAARTAESSLGAAELPTPAPPGPAPRSEFATIRSTRTSTTPLSWAEKQRLLRQRRCFRCKRPGHFAANCFSRGCTNSPNDDHQ